MKISAVVRALVSAGASPEMILAAVVAAEEQEVDALERRRASDRERQQRRRHVTSRDVTVTERDTLSSDKERSPTPPKEINSIPETSSLRSDVPAQAPSQPTPKTELKSTLDDERAAAVIDHRKRIGKPLTPRAAHLLAGKFAKCADPNAAADAMIANGWQGFEPEWLDRRQQSHRQSQAPPVSAHQQRHQTALDALRQNSWSETR